MRVRLACARPVLIGLQTVARLRSGSVLDPEKRIKISRKEVKQWIWRSIVYYPILPIWRRLAERAGSER